MTYLVTLNPDTDGAVSRIVADDDIHGTFNRMCTNLHNGESIQVRRADYLDTGVGDEVVFERPKLTLIRGGNTCTG